MTIDFEKYRKRWNLPAVKAARSRERNRSRATVGQIYIVGIVNGGPVKAGFSKRLAPRLIAIQAWTPHTIELLVVVSGSKYHELAILSLMRDWRIRGEWFGRNRTLDAIVSHATAHGSLPPYVDELAERLRLDHKSGKKVYARIGLGRSRACVLSPKPINPQPE